MKKGGRQWGQTVLEIDADARTRGWSPEDITRLWRTHDLIARLFSGRYRGAGRPFISHLAGTAGLALEHGGSVDEVLAGYAHAAYSEGEFGRVRLGASPANRRELRGAIGEEAEALVADYDDLAWHQMAVRHNIDEVLALSPQQKRILFLQVVNELEDSFDFGAYDGRWRAGCLVRLEAAADFADALGNGALAEYIRANIAQLRVSPPPLPERLREKHSVTLRNRSSKPIYLLSKMRRFLSFWSRLKNH